MSYKISLLNTSFNCDGVENLVLSAQKKGVTINHSCLNGQCTACKTKIISGTTSVINDEYTLSISEKKKGYILACCRVATSNLDLDTEDLSSYNVPKQKTLPAKINEIKLLTDEVIFVSLRLPPGEMFNFLPGQYVEMKRDSIGRSYSIANITSNKCLEFFIKKYDGGQMSKYWFSSAKKDDLLRIVGPKGSFFLRTAKNEIKNLLFLATGTGIAPIKSIIESPQNRDFIKNKERIILYWGVKYLQDVFWSPKLDDLGIEFCTITSRENNKKIYIQDELNELNLNFSQTVVYGCGSINMLHDSKQILVSKGLKKYNFYADAFLPTK